MPPHVAQVARHARARSLATDARAGRCPGTHARDKLPQLTAPSILCLQAGNVNSGAFDPFEPLCAAARDAGAWIHVDGAFGLWARASGALSHLARGLELADSWATDAHKWLNVPYDSGIAFVRDGHALQSAMAITAEYLPGQSERRNPADFTPELSRRARGVEVWRRSEPRSRRTRRDDRAQLRTGAAIRTGLQSGIRGPERRRAEPGRGSLRRCERTRRIIEAIQQDGTCWAGVTVWRGRAAMRISVSSWATTDDDVDRSLEAMLRCARECS